MMEAAFLEGCGADQASWTEKQIIYILYIYGGKDINLVIKVTLLEGQKGKEELNV